MSRYNQHKPGYIANDNGSYRNRSDNKKPANSQQLINMETTRKIKKQDRFLPIAEHLAEQFSSSCEIECTNPNISQKSKEACDSGAMKYCFDDFWNNINKDTCKSFFRDVSEKAKTESAPDYYSILNTEIVLKINKIIQEKNRSNTLTNEDIVQLFNSLSYNKTINQTLFRIAHEKCQSINDPLWISLSPDIGAWTYNTSQSFVDNIQASNIDFLISLDIIRKELFNTYTKLEQAFEPITQYIKKNLTLDNINNEMLIEFRNNTTILKSTIDLFVINMIKGTDMTYIPIDQNTGHYNVDITNYVMLYNTNIRKFYKNIPSTDIMYMLIEKADIDNKDRWNTIPDTSKDPVSIAMKATGDPNLMPPAPKVIEQPEVMPSPTFPSSVMISQEVSTASNAPIQSQEVSSSSIPEQPPVNLIPISEQTLGSAANITTQNATIDMSYCMDLSNPNDDVCVAYINNLPKTEADKNTIFPAVLDATFKKDGPYRSVLDKYDGLQNWIVNTTSDKTSTDDQGRLIISSSCGGDNILSKQQCSNICKAYPELCEKDVVQKCSLPEYRYNTENFTQEAFQCKGDDNTVAIILIAILFFTIVASLLYCKYRKKCSLIYKNIDSQQTNKINS